MDHYTITKESLSVARYHWGLLRTIAVEHMFTIVLHPEHWETVVKVCAPEDFVPDMEGFTDETRTKYRVALVAGGEDDAEDFYIVFTKMYRGNEPEATVRIGVNEFAEVLDVDDELAIVKLYE